ncbi:hypothetical protein [Halobellus rufus]|uniref:hypothetical protein n=1 Tax=Halobellus rufus TaxID=1448860 RepID=UPI00067844E3|nr:hypothetical protein [Halobellus rufus]
MKRRTLLGITSASMVSLTGCLGATEYTITDVQTEATTPLDISVAIVEPDAVIEHPAQLAFTVTNKQEEPIEIRNTGIWPFGLLELVPSLDTQDAGPGTILWTDRYEESRYVDAETRQNYGVESTPLVRTLDPDETVEETYDVHGDDVIQTGTMYVRGRFEPPILEYTTEHTEGWNSFSPEITVEIAGQSLI